MIGWSYKRLKVFS